MIQPFETIVLRWQVTVLALVLLGFWTAMALLIGCVLAAGAERKVRLWWEKRRSDKGGIYFHFTGPGLGPTHPDIQDVINRARPQKP